MELYQMKIFKSKKDGRLYTIIRNLIGRCVCGKCGGKYTATEYPRWFGASSMELSSVDDFAEVGER
jgi:hypothetical protein